MYTADEVAKYRNQWKDLFDPAYDRNKDEHNRVEAPVLLCQNFA